MTERQLDQETPASTRKVFVVLLVLGGLVLLIPRQWVSAIILFGLAGLLLAAHLWLGWRNKKREAAPPVPEEAASPAGNASAEGGP